MIRLHASSCPLIRSMPFAAPLTPQVPVSACPRRGLCRRQSVEKFVEENAHAFTFHSPIHPARNAFLVPSLMRCSSFIVHPSAFPKCRLFQSSIYNQQSPIQISQSSHSLFFRYAYRLHVLSPLQMCTSFGEAPAQSECEGCP